MLPSNKIELVEILQLLLINIPHATFFAPSALRRSLGLVCLVYSIEAINKIVIIVPTIRP